MIVLYEVYRLYYTYHADEQAQALYARVILNLVSMIIFPVLSLTRARRILGMHTSYLRSFLISFSIFLAGSFAYVVYYLYRKDMIDVSLGGELVDFEYMQDSILSLLLRLAISTIPCAVISLFFRKPKFTEQAISDRLSNEFDLVTLKENSVSAPLP
mgnify:CR=1 FL=1